MLKLLLFGSLTSASALIQSFYRIEDLIGGKMLRVVDGVLRPSRTIILLLLTIESRSSEFTEKSS